MSQTVPITPIVPTTPVANTALQTQLQQLLAQPNFSASTLQILLSPAPLYLQNTTVMTELLSIISIITEDRNGNNTFDIGDIVLLSTNIDAVIGLITAIVLLISNLPSIKIDYTAGDTETFIYKILLYILLVILPSKLNMQFTADQLQSILSACNMIYDFLIQSGVLDVIIDDVYNWTKKEALACWTCFTTDVSAIEKKMPMLKANLRKSLKK